MFSKGEYVVYGISGVCKIGGITTLDIADVPKDKEYYVLYPKENGGTIYIPIENADSKMRRVLTREEAEELIKKMPDIEPVHVVNEKLMEEMYKKCMRHYDCTEWIRLIKCIYHRKQLRLSEGKKITATDEKYMHLAEASLYSELGIALDVPKEQVLDYIINEVENNNKVEK